MPSGKAVAPAGTLTMTGILHNTTSVAFTVTVPLTPAVDLFTGAVEGIGAFVAPAGASGIYNLAFTYTPSNPTYYNGITGTGQALLFPASASLLASTTTATTTSIAATPASAVAVTTTIVGQSGKPAPTGSITFSSVDAGFGTFTLTPGTGITTTATVLFTSEGLVQGSNPITVAYSGDAVYAPSSAVVTIANPLSDFQMVPLTTIVNVPPNGSATDTILLTSTNEFAGVVSFNCVGTGGVTCSLNPAPTTLTAGEQQSVTLTVNSSTATRMGTYSVVVTGSDSTGNFLHTLGLQAVVSQVSPSYAVTGTPLAETAAGSSATSTITTTPTGGFMGSVALTCAVTGPTGAVSSPTCSISPTPVASTGATAMTSTLTVATTSMTSTGNHSVVVTGTSGTTKESAALLLVVGVLPPPPPAPTFTLTGLANQAVAAGFVPGALVTATPSNGFTGSVALTCTVTGPAGATDVPTCSISPTTVQITNEMGAGSYLILTTTTGTTGGDYTVTVAGTLRAITATDSFVLTVAAAPPAGIMLTATTPINIAYQGAQATAAVTVTPNNGFTGNVAVACTVTASPAGAINTPTCALTPSSVDITTASAAATTLTVNTTAQNTSQLKLPGELRFALGGGVMITALFFVGGPVARGRNITLKRLRVLRILSVILFALVAGFALGCGAGNHNGSGGGGGTTSGGTTTGSYTVTLTATPATGTAVTATVAISVN